MKGGRLFLLAAAVLVMTVICSCQIVGRGEIQNVPVTSKPPGINVLVDGQLAGRTPIILKVERRNVRTVRFEAEGYRTVEIQITQRKPPAGEAMAYSL